MFKKIGLQVIILLCFFSSLAQEGMWLPHLLAELNESDMQNKGMQMTAEDIYSINQGSLKDAIVHFGGFCTGEIVSSQGLLITNHHCGYGAIQDHSSVDENLLEDGFWAMNQSEELPNDGLYVTFIRKIIDVTDAMLSDVTDEMTEEERASKIDYNETMFIDNFEVGEHEEAKIKSFYHGNQYFLFVTESYYDVRLVGAPPSSIGKFGADTDNWEWPRHTGDFAVFRVYTAPDGSPAKYSEENIPLSPIHHLPVSLDGVEEGDFTLVFGFPGRTNEYLPSYAIEQIVEDINPKRIALREVALNVMDKHMRKDEEIKIKYASKFASIANYWKKWKGENQGLKKSNAIQLKRQEEERFRELVNEDAKFFAYFSGILEDYERVYEGQKDMVITQSLLSEMVGRIVELYRNASNVRRAINVYENNGSGPFKAYLEEVQKIYQNRFENYDQGVDLEMAIEVSKFYKKNVGEKYVPLAWYGKEEDLEEHIRNIYNETSLLSIDKFNKLISEENIDTVYQRLKRDPALIDFNDLITNYQLHTYPDLTNYDNELKILHRNYMSAQMYMYPDKTFYPDANSTMRVTYGQVRGYEPRDGIIYNYYTTLEGVMEKYMPGDYEFDVSSKLIELYEEKDYGRYAREDGSLPVCFLGSNHTTGGNSGSPVIDAHGNFIGLNFDRVWEGTMSDYHYDEAICRNIMVDARYILFIIDKYAGAGHLVEEMTLVHPKK